MRRSVDQGLFVGEMLREPFGLGAAETETEREPDPGPGYMGPLG